MAANVFLKVTGAKQGQIKGGVTQKGREGTIPVTAFSYGVISPRDSASGLPTGKRQHRPVLVTSPTGPQTPKLFEALVTNEDLTAVELDVYEPNRTGVESLALTIKLTNASQAELDVDEQPSGAAETLADHYSFTFQKIEVTWVPGKIVGSDDWEGPVA
jgi:type VI secretion system secreted protein Hcp